MIKISLPLFSSAFENISYKYLPRQILHRNSNGKTSYFKREVQLRLAAITRFKKDLKRVSNTISKLFLLCGPFRQVTPFRDIRMFTHPPPLRRRVLPFLSLSYDPLSLQNLASNNLIQQRHTIKNLHQY